MMGKDDLDDSLIGVNDLEPDNPHRFQVAMNGDHMMVPFQCDLCHFMNIQKWAPLESSQQDDLLKLAICQVNLDSFWSRESSTVLANFWEGKREAKIKKIFGMEDKILPQRGPFPLEDVWGVAEACCIVWRSLDAGKNLQQVQFDTICKIRTFQSNYSHAGWDGTGSVFMGTDGSNSRVSNAEKNLLWFSRFMQGCHKRMGDLNFPDKAVDRYIIRGCFDVGQCMWDRNELDNYAQRQVAWLCVSNLRIFWRTTR